MVTVKADDLPIVANAFSSRVITHAFHDIDGTHSLIREWVPVMSIVLFDVIENGLPLGYDSLENVKRLVNEAGKKSFEETDRFCVVSAGLSALTQMEWAIRRAVQNNRISVDFNGAINDSIINRIWEGEEQFPDKEEPDSYREFIKENAPRLFRFYEKVLNGFCRDKNLEEAKKDPEKFQVGGSVQFMEYLKSRGVKNYFVTGAVVEQGVGMHEEVTALGYKIGKGETVEALLGSTWDEKKPKDEVMHELMEELSLDGSQILVVGDGRSEISAGVKMGALTISRLDKNADEQIKLHKGIGSNIIVNDYTGAEFYKIFE